MLGVNTDTSSMPVIAPISSAVQSEVKFPSPNELKPPTLAKLNRTVEKIINSDTPEECIAKAKIDLVLLYEQLNEIALNAKIFVKDRDGDPIELGADNRARTTAIALILELAKHLKDKSMVQQVALFDSTAIEDAKRVLALRKKGDV